MQQWYQCPTCGGQVAFGTRFCGNCGVQLNWPTQQYIQEQRDDVMVSLINFASEKAAEGKKRSEVADELTRMGVPYPVAGEVVKGVFEHRSKLKRKEGGKAMGCGLLMLIVGGVITLVSYRMAEGTGGMFFVMWGLIGIGVITMLVGFFRWLTS
jgi:hypothetical protein